MPVSKMPEGKIVDADGVLTKEGIAWVQGIEKTSNATSSDLANYSTKVRELNIQTGTSYAILAADSGKIVGLNNSSSVTVTVGSGLGAGFQVDLIQIGAGQVTVSASGVTILSEDSKLKLAKQGSAATLAAYAADTFILAGSLST